MFKRLFNLFSGLLSSIIRVFESKNPAALIEAEKNNLRHQVTRLNLGLSEQAGVVYNLAAQTQKASDSLKEQEQRISILLEAGDQQNAARAALKFNQLQKELNELQTRCRCAEESYQALEKARDRAVAEATGRIARLESLLSQTEILNAQSELAEIAGSITRSSGCSQNSLGHTEEIIEKNLQNSLGRAHVNGARLERLEQDQALSATENAIREKRALAEYLAGRGLQTDPAAKTVAQVALLKPERRISA